MSEKKEYSEIPQEDGIPITPKPFGLGVRHLQMLCMMMSMITLFIARSSMAVAVLAMTDTRRENDTNVQIFHWDKKTQGVMLSSFFWGYLVMQIPGGALAKRYGGKPMLEAALVSTGLISLLTPFLASVGDWYLVCAFRGIMGLSQACTFSASHTLLGKWLPASESTIYIGIVYGGSSLGNIIGLPLSGVLADTALGWKMIFYSLAAMNLVMALMWHFFAASSPGEHRMMTAEEKHYIEIGKNISVGTKKTQRTPWREILTSRGLWAIMISQFGMTITFILFMSDLPTFLEKGLKISLKNSASLSALPYIGSWIGGIMTSWLSQTIINRKLMSLIAVRKTFNSIGFLGGTLGLVSLSFLGPSNAHWAIVALVAVMFLQSFGTGGFMANYLDISPNFGGVMMSIVNCVSNAGSVVTPIVTSLILRNDPTDVSRWHVVFLLFAGVLLAAGAVYVLLGDAATAPWDKPDYCTRTQEKVPENEKQKESENMSV